MKFFCLRYNNQIIKITFILSYLISNLINFSINISLAETLIEEIEEKENNTEINKEKKFNWRLLIFVLFGCFVVFLFGFWFFIDIFNEETIHHETKVIPEIVITPSEATLSSEINFESSLKSWAKLSEKLTMGQSITYEEHLQAKKLFDWYDDKFVQFRKYEK